MLEGLEVAEVPLSQLEFSGRLDAEYYQPIHLKADTLVLRNGGYALSSLCDFLIGPFGSAFTVENYTDDQTYRYIRGKDVKPMALAEDDNVYMPKADFDRLSKYALRAGDVLVSVVGTLGNSALIEEQHLPAVFSCKSTALRTRIIDPRYLITYLNCKYGRALLMRKERGAVQKGLNLDDLKTLSVYVAGQLLQKKIAECHHTSAQARDDARKQSQAAEVTLLRALGLEHWQAPEPLSYIRDSSEAFAAGRLDAEFFTPRVRDMLARLGRDGLTIQDVAPVRKERFTPGKNGDFHYIEIGGLGADGTAQSECLPQQGAPSRATQYVRAGDVITSTVRPIRRLSAVIDDNQNGFVCSSGFVVLQPRTIRPDVLLTYLRLPPVCVLMDLHTSASMYPAISETDLLALPIPKIPLDIQQTIERSAQTARQAKQRATRLLDAAKRAVEIAIEDSETAALAYLESVVADTDSGDQPFRPEVARI